MEIMNEFTFTVWLRWDYYYSLGFSLTEDALFGWSNNKIYISKWEVFWKKRRIWVKTDGGS